MPTIYDLERKARLWDAIVEKSVATLLQDRAMAALKHLNPRTNKNATQEDIDAATATARKAIERRAASLLKVIDLRKETAAEAQAIVDKMGVQS